MKKLSLLMLMALLGSCAGNKQTTQKQDLLPNGDVVETAQDVAETVQDVSETATDVGQDTAETKDVAQDTTQPVKIAWDQSLPKVPLKDLTQPVAFKAGASVVRMPVPLGICTAGFGPAGGHKTPFTDNFPGSWTLYLHPQLRAVALEGGMGRLIIIRSDTVGALAEIRQTLLNKLKKATGHDFSNELILTGTHTHSGPGRLATGIFSFLLDTFWPEFYDRLSSAMALAALKALQNMKPARFGWYIASDHKAHNDRRCENPPLEDPSMPLLRFEGMDGNTIALVLVYAVHGTILGAKLHNLSRDVAGGIEEKVQEKIGGNFPVLFINSWAADMGPGDSLEETAVDKHSDSIIDGYTRIEGIGNRVAKTVAAVWDKFTFTTQVDLDSKTLWIPLNRKAIGYTGDEFPYEYGAVYCQGKGKCWDDTKDRDQQIKDNHIDGLDHACLPFRKDQPGPDRTLFTVGHIGNLYFVTWPGEAVTSIGQDLMKYIADQLKGQDKPDQTIGTAFFGYAQDYTGYSTPEWDWWLGGYEASGAMWGPKQGDYITAKEKEGIKGYLSGNIPKDLTQLQPVTEPDYSYDTPFRPTVSVEPGTVVQDVKDKYGMLDTVEFSVNAGDPWLLAPIAVLEKKDGDQFKPVIKPDGKTMNSDGYDFFVTLAVDPKYKDRKTKTRKFTWTFHLPITRAQAQVTPITPGTYRLSVTGKYVDQHGKIQDLSVHSKDFLIQ